MWLVRLDDYALIERVVCRSLSIIIAPKRDIMVVWTRDKELLEDLARRKEYMKHKTTRNGIYIVWLRLDLHCKG